MFMRVSVKVTVSKKSAVRMASACERRNVVQVSQVCWGAGSIPASLRIRLPHRRAFVFPVGSSWPDCPPPLTVGL
jgi:hypothetical protein